MCIHKNKGFFILSFVLFLNGCLAIGTNKILINTNKTKFPIGTISTVQIENNQIKVTGNNLDHVTSLKIQNNTTDEIFSVESVSANQIIANASRAVTIGIGQTFNLIINSAEGAATFPFTFAFDDTSNIGLGTSTPISRLQIKDAPTATADKGLISIGLGPFDGSSSGYFDGSAQGTVEAINMATGYTGNFAHYKTGTRDDRFIVKYDGSIISGRGFVTGADSASFGGANTSSGGYSFSMGHFNVSSAFASLSTGLFTTASGDDSSAFGYGTTANSFGMMSVGINNDIPAGVSSSAWVATDPVFVVGNGTTSAPSTALTILKNGKVGIGNTSPTFSLDVTGDMNSTTALFVGGVQVCTSAGCAAPSDRRLKENVKYFDHSLEKIMQLQGLEYNYINKEKYGDGKQIGFIAQDVQKVFPEVVITDKKSGYLSIAYDHLIAPVVDAVKELNFKIVSLENKQNILDHQLISKIERDEFLELKKELQKKDKQIKLLEARLELIEKTLVGNSTEKK